MGINAWFKDMAADTSDGGSSGDEMAIRRLTKPPLGLVAYPQRPRPPGTRADDARWSVGNLAEGKPWPEGLLPARIYNLFYSFT